MAKNHKRPENSKFPRNLSREAFTFLLQNTNRNLLRESLFGVWCTVHEKFNTNVPFNEL